MELAVVLVFHHKPVLDWYERVSLEQCYRVLHRHPIRLVCPEGMDLAQHRSVASGLVPDFIPAKWLASLQAYNRLKVLPFLYRRYSRYQYVLTYELDAFVFRDDLLQWCAEGWDYIGAPWFEGYSRAKPDANPIGVGNSGFSLRRVGAMLRVARTWRYRTPFKSLIRSWKAGKRGVRQILSDLTFRNNFFGPCNDFDGHEDFFWALAARRFPWFRLPAYEVARQFAFEVNPSRLYRESEYKLPFGCHKWMKHEPDFWQQQMRLSAPTATGHEVPVSGS